MKSNSLEDVSSSSDSSSESKEEVVSTLIVRYQDYDGTELAVYAVEPGDPMPEYAGDTPYRPIDASFFYIFSGWSSMVYGPSEIVYTATYEARNYTNTDNFYWGFTDTTYSKVTLAGFSDPGRQYEDIYIPDEILYEGKSYPVAYIESFAVDTHYAKRIRLGKYVEDVGPLFISNCLSTSIEYIDVDPENPYLCSIDGILYTKDKKELIKAPLELTMETLLLPDEDETLRDMSLQETFGIRNFETTAKSQLKTIGMQAFSGSRIQNVHLPNGLKRIALRAFWLNDFIQTLTIPGTVEFDNEEDAIQFASMSQLNTLTFEEGITSLPASVCTGNPNLSAINLPSTLKSIGNFAFWQSPRLYSIDLPSGLTSIGDSAFYDTGLSSITVDQIAEHTGFNLPSGVTEIADWAFASTSLSGTVYIPAQVTSIGHYSFLNNPYLSDYEVSSSSKSFASVGGVLYNKDVTKLILTPNALAGTFTLPDTVTELDDLAFSNNKNVTKFNAGKGLLKIGDGAFSSSVMTEINLNEGLKEIGDNAFSNTKSLESLSFPSTCESLGNSAFLFSDIKEVSSWGGIKKIEDYAFYSASSFESLDMSDSCVEELGDFLFSGCPVKEVIGGPALKTISSYSIYAGENISKVDLGATQLEILPNNFIYYVSDQLDTLVLPKTLQKLEHNALSHSSYDATASFTKLKNIQYTGTVEEWNALMANSKLTATELSEFYDGQQWYGSSRDYIRSVTVNYGTADAATYAIDLQANAGLIEDGATPIE